MNSRIFPFPSGVCGAGPNRRRRSAAKRGFSLVEVVLALGIMSFGVMPLVALLPIGLSVNRQAIGVTVATQIVSRVTQEAVQTDYSLLPNGSSQPLTYCFDDQGNLLSSGTSGSLFATCTDRRRIYDVQATVNQDASLPASGGAGGASTAQSASLARIKIDIGYNPGRNPNLFTSGANTAYLTYFTFVSKND